MYSKGGVMKFNVLRKAQSLLLSAVILFLNGAASTSHAGTFTAFDPQDFTRGNGKPVVESTTFSIKNPDTSYTLNIYNGGAGSEYKKVSSAIVELNGSNLFGTKDFNQKTFFLEKQVNVSNSNKLDVELRSIPDSGLTVLIEGEDNSPPAIDISTPPDNTYTNSPSVTVSGSATDSISWVEKISVNGANANISGESFSVSNIQLNEGTNAITATVTDAAGNSGSDSATIILDTIAPVINLNRTATITNNPAFNMSGSVNDVSPITSVTVNGSPVDLSGNIFSTTINLAEGSNSITVSATDKAGNVGSATIEVLLDTTPPQVTIASPINQTYLNNPQIEVSGSASDALSGVQSLTINGVETELLGGAYSSSGIQLAEGTNTVKVVATDKAGNPGELSVTVILDTISPQITLNELPNITNNPTVTISGLLSDSSPISGLTLNGISVEVFGDSFTSEYNLSEGTNTITVTAEDEAGNIGSIIISITLDATPPVISVTSHQSGGTVDTDTIDIIGTTDDNSATVTVNGITASISNGTFSVSGITLNEGENSITVTAVDVAGNTTVQNLTVTYSAPQVSSGIILSIPHWMGAITLEDGIDLSYVTETLGFWPNNGQVHTNIQGYYEGLSADLSAQVLMNGQIVSFWSDSFWVNLILEEGSNTITITIKFTDGRTVTDSITVYYYDKMPPYIYIYNPPNGLTTIDDNISIRCYINDFDPNPTLTVNGIEAVVSGGYFTVDGIPLEVGLNTLTITATDKTGNTSTQSRTVYRLGDTTPPAISITSPADGSTVNAAAVSITGIIDDNSAQVIVNGIQAVVSSNSFEAHSIPLEEGENSITITATDQSGNATSTSLNVLLDSTPPGISSTVPSDNSSDISASASISVAFSEVVCSSGVTSGVLKLHSEYGNDVSGNTTCSGNTLIFTPLEQLNSLTAYYASVKGVKDAVGNIMEEEFNWGFKTTFYIEPIDIYISYPQDGSNINGSSVIVKGIFDSETPDIGIKVNGVLAEVNGNEWAAVISLQVGRNTITVEANSGIGGSGKESIKVNSDGATPSVEISLNPQSGIAPLEANFDIDVNFNNETSDIKIDFEGDGVIDLETTTIEGITNTYYSVGLYYPVITVVDSNGNQYHATTVLNVLDVQQMDALFKSIWTGLKDKLAEGNAEEALDYFSDSAKEKYSRVFSDLGEDLPQIVSTFGDIAMNSIEGEIAEYVTIREQDGGTFAYFIYFMRDSNGIWKIKGM